MSDLAAAVGVPISSVADLLATFTAHRLTIATAESLTGGLLVALLTEIPGSSAVVRGGLVVYATELKHQLARVDQDLLAQGGPVDPRVAAALADGARRECGAVVGVGLTGVAGPDPQDGLPVGTWFSAVSGPGSHRDERHNGRLDARDAGRGQIRAAAVRSALDMLTNIAATFS